MNLFPLPNAFDPAHSYNDVFQRPIEQPHSDTILRVDWNISSNTTFYARGIKDYQATRGDFGFVLASPAWPQLPVNYEIPCQGIVGTLIHTFSPHRVNEFTMGVNRGVQTEEPLTDAGLARNQRSISARAFRSSTRMRIHTAWFRMRRSEAFQMLRSSTSMRDSLISGEIMSGSIWTITPG